MRGVLENDRCGDRADPLGNEVAERSAFFDSDGEVMRIAGQASSRLSSSQQLRQLRMALMKFHTIGGNALEQLDRLVFAPVPVIG